MNSGSTKYRLAMVTPYPIQPNHVQGGVESVAATLIKGLQELNVFEIHVVAPASGETIRIEERNGIFIHWVPTSRLPGVLRYWTVERRAIQRCLHKIKPDITHFQGVTGWAIGYKRPYVVTIHGIAEKDALYTKARFPKLRYRIIAAVERFSRRRAPHVIAISPYVLGELRSQFSGRIWDIENPVDASFFKVTRAATENNVLYVGRIIERKNIHGLIDAFSKLSRSVTNATLLLGGTADSDQYMNDRIRQLEQLEISNRVIFLGSVRHDELPAKLATAKCLILLSHQETAPMAIEEAMAAGVPVVASNICGIPFMIENGVTGYLINPDTPSDAAAAITKILNNHDLADALSARSRDVAKERFHYHNVARKTAAVYFSALGLPDPVNG